MSVVDLSFEAESPLAPPAELLERLPSYDWLFQRGDNHRVPLVTEEVAREALLSFVSSKCCYGSTAAGDLIIQELKQQTLCRYRLETFSESRISEWTFQPFTKPVSGWATERDLSQALGHQGPGPPDVSGRHEEVPSPSFVTSQEMLMSEMECHKCHGRGRYKCSGCHGAGMMKGLRPRETSGLFKITGLGFEPGLRMPFAPFPGRPAGAEAVVCPQVRCPSCSGAKRKAKQSRRCQMCSGSGRRRCSTCSGRGSKTCATCKGEKRLLHFIQLVIMWKNSLFEFVSEHRLNCPRELLAKAKGESLFKDENTAVYPIVDFPLREISLASQRGIAEHSAALSPRARVLQQRQTIELIPVTEVHYWYRGQTYVYYIYGTDHRVHVVDYPDRYCFGCTII
ncbi:protein SSUH2 homolog [Prionailurus iriomotensis]